MGKKYRKKNKLELYPLTWRDVYDIFLSEKNNLQNNVQAKMLLWNLTNSCQCAHKFAWIKARRVHTRL